MKTPQLRQTDLASYRNQKLREQNGLCMMCGLPIVEGEAVLDHDHKTGHCRGVSHRTCNVVEGKIKNAIQRGGNRTNTLALLQGLVEYLQKDFSDNPIHPKHKTSDKKEIVRLKRQTKKLEARVATLKRQKAKLKTKAAQDKKQLAIKAAQEAVKDHKAFVKQFVDDCTFKLDEAA